MWNSRRVFEYEGMIAETVGITGHDGKPIHAYYSRPLGVEKFPGIVLIPHMPGWDEWCRETSPPTATPWCAPTSMRNTGTGPPPRFPGGL